MKYQISKFYPKLRQILLYLFLIAYLYFLVHILLFKNVAITDVFSVSRIIDRPLELIPFKSSLDILTNGRGFAMIELLGNIIFFVPLGIYLKMFKVKETLLKYAYLIFAISLSVEVIQFTFGLGVADIDDVILNTIGGVLGVFIFMQLESKLKSESKSKTVILIGWLVIAVLVLYVSSRFIIRL
ncbi:MAG: VanZ family protein [Candidatus Dojkabacteria bacterium]